MINWIAQNRLAAGSSSSKDKPIGRLALAVKA
jgi:hypothetical protein